MLLPMGSTFVDLGYFLSATPKTCIPSIECQLQPMIRLFWSGSAASWQSSSRSASSGTTPHFCVCSCSACQAAILGSPQPPRLISLAEDSLGSFCNSCICGVEILFLHQSVD